ncbi:hypothetical protein SERLA73DRAFT_71955 [Serpula lacrymans var. lacrymans S7.3]|uniref:Protein kinase domain-containing protein n=2 Tax=Serpula lacrymans var. lacrymans TaxID=341189 RepID=F8PTG1_SERL3|nr:uncharacterized protein SERLADRAFT_436432 [Serpula lacrymans var. lacrymans S7.9]EGO00989.1 hypothetical protein SERLA73DRAFT_71955 [Serpula lacrymans var. lacrymans S7.3]EGO26622.1 hypothetical protein SERLADRAFT_436432 [Serpula lacrymans var. lacrymans S7.9]
MVYFKVTFPQYRYILKKKVIVSTENLDGTSCNDSYSEMDATKAEWPCCDSIITSPTIFRTTHSSRQQEALLLEDITDAYHSAEVLDVRRKISMFPYLRKWAFDYRKSLDRLGPIRALDSYFHSFDSQTGNTSSPTLSDRTMKLNDLQIMETIGEGAFATVFKVKDRKTSRLLALKVISKEDHRMARPDYLLREQAALRRAAGCSGLLQLEASFHDSKKYYMAVTYHCGGDLSLEIQKWRRLPTNIVRFYTAELVDALHALHKRGIIHRDIKPSNILIDSSGHLVIADFGLARLYHTATCDIVNPYWFTACAEAQKILKGPYLTKKGCGTPEYMAPEIWMGKKYSFAVDFWALGITVHEMITGRIPWNSRNCVSKMLVKEPYNRLSYEAIKKHSFFQDIDWDKIESHAVPAPYISYTEECKCATDADIECVEAGELYGPLDDPLPEFTYLSPLLDQPPTKVSSKFHIRQLMKKGFISRVSNGEDPPSLNGVSYVPRSCTLMSDTEVMDYWWMDSDQMASSPLISESPIFTTSLTTSRVSRCQSSGAVVLKCFASLASFTSNFVKSGSSSPTILNSSSRTDDTGPRKGKFRMIRWFKRTWNPIPKVQNLSGTKRKIIDLTA